MNFNLNKKEKELLMYCVLAFVTGYLMCMYFPVHGVNNVPVMMPVLEGVTNNDNMVCYPDPTRKTPPKCDTDEPFKCGKLNGCLWGVESDSKTGNNNKANNNNNNNKNNNNNNNNNNNKNNNNNNNKNNNKK